MKIGVAIPCYGGHITKLYNLLDSIEYQTRLPDRVVVSCSSSDTFQLEKMYKYPIEIIITKDHKNAAQNRNIALSKLMDMDYITFIDADDIMHMQRIEILEYAANTYNCDIIMHNFYKETYDKKLLKTKYSIWEMFENKLTIADSGCITHTQLINSDYDIHHSQSTVKSDICKKVKYNEQPEYARMEDSLFCKNVFELGNIKNIYIPLKLSYYAPSYTPF